MFAYQDPTETDFLKTQGALDEYRAIMQGLYTNTVQLSLKVV